MKIYAFAWLLLIGTIIITYLTGNITTFTLPLLGFALGTMFFLGLVAILPVWLNNYFAPKLLKPRPSAKLINVR